jgi:hypothetical protein
MYGRKQKFPLINYFTYSSHNKENINMFIIWNYRYGPLGNRIKPDICMTTKKGRGENQHVHPATWNFVHWLPRNASTITYRCIALLQLLYRWRYQSRKLWISLKKMLFSPCPIYSYVHIAATVLWNCLWRFPTRASIDLPDTLWSVIYISETEF